MITLPLYFQGPKLRAPLMAAIKGGDVEEARKLLSDGADVNTEGENMTLMEDVPGVTLPSCPLLWAVLHRDAAMVKVLLEAGADPKLPCGLSILSLHGPAALIDHAIENGDEDILRYLLEAGTNISGALAPDFRTHGSFRKAASRNPHLLNVLMQYGADVNRLDPSGDTDLHKALRDREHDSFGVVERLLAFGADVNLPNSQTGITPLMMAIIVKSPQGVVELLLMKGANPYRWDYKRRNALHWAAKSKTDNLWALGRLIQENMDLECIRNYHLRQLTTFQYLCEVCRKYFMVTYYDWTRPYYCLRAMNILLTVGAKVPNQLPRLDGSAGLIEELHWFREQAELIYKEPHQPNIARGLGMEEKHIEEIRDILTSLTWNVSNVDELRHLCRLKIRAILKINFRKRLEMLCLPTVLHNYILMRDLAILEP